MSHNRFWQSSLLAIAILFTAVARAEVVWIDVRTSLEHTVDSIDGDVRIPHDDIVEGVSETFPDKNTEIHLYCRSGGRADAAKSALEQAGYTHVISAGGIDDARRERGIGE